MTTKTGLLDFHKMRITDLKTCFKKQKTKLFFLSKVQKL